METTASTQKITDLNVALAKAEQYCAYQERAQQEVRDKLYSWGLGPDAVEQTIVKLIETNFINEERFARMYAKGKFSQKNWGRIKIKQGLKFKKVPDKLIQKALTIIDNDDYLKTLEVIVQKKNLLLNEKDSYKKRYKLHQYALSRGFENDLIADVLNNSGL